MRLNQNLRAFIPSAPAWRICVIFAMVSILGFGGCRGKEKEGKNQRSLPTQETSPGSGETAAQGGRGISASPWKIPSRYAGLLGDYRKTWSCLAGPEFSGLHWKQNISLYVNKEPDRYVQNYLEYKRLYVDQDIEESEDETGENRFEPYSVGTIFLKENYLPQEGMDMPGKPLTITAMVKRDPGYDPVVGDWEFIQLDLEGNVLIDGNSQDALTQAMCIKCHANMSERDFVFSTFWSFTSATSDTP